MKKHIFLKSRVYRETSNKKITYLLVHLVKVNINTKCNLLLKAVLKSLNILWKIKDGITNRNFVVHVNAQENTNFTQVMNAKNIFFKTTVCP